MVVMSYQEFEELLEILDETIVNQLKGFNNIQLESCKQHKIIPMIGYGEKTKHIFEKYNIKTKAMSIICKNHKNREISDVLNDEYKLLDPVTQSNIQNAIEKIIDNINGNPIPEIKKYIYSLSNGVPDNFRDELLAQTIKSLAVTIDNNKHIKEDKIKGVLHDYIKRLLTSISVTFRKFKGEDNEYRPGNN